MRGTIAHLLDVLQSYGPSTRLDVVLEEGHKNAGDARRVFEDIRKIFGEFGDTLLGDFTTVRKPDAMPLMVADFMAFTTARCVRAGPPLRIFGRVGRRFGARKPAGPASPISSFRPWGSRASRTTSRPFR
jgi:hypothetical protein